MTTNIPIPITDKLNPLLPVPSVPKRPKEPEVPDKIVQRNDTKSLFIASKYVSFDLQELLQLVNQHGIKCEDFSNVLITSDDGGIVIEYNVSVGKPNPNYDIEMHQYLAKKERYDKLMEEYNNAVKIKDEVVEKNRILRDENRLRELALTMEKKGYNITVTKKD